MAFYFHVISLSYNLSKAIGTLEILPGIGGA